MKRNNVSPPTFPSPTGEAVIAYASHDGRAVIGDGVASFETKWSKASGSSIHVMNDPPGICGVALATAAKSPDDVTAAMVAGLDFTSRNRTPREGQVIVFENEAGRFLAAQVVDVLARDYGDSEDRLVLRYAVLPDDQPTSAMDVARLAAEIEAELRRLRPINVGSTPTHGGMGHNNPPEPTPLALEEHDRAIEAVQRIAREAAAIAPDRSAVTQAANTLRSAAVSVAEWVGRKCNLAAEEFAKQVGKSLAAGLALSGGWLILSGKIDALLAIVGTWLP